ncbi:hypothetical protein NW762_012006 [Fusarium torreyae]|uniref:Parasitic phase-specific protein PSP-1 n=1 Tax=Fusarium torreyae TaxID=1237075 RepID=A0A9W8RNF6_9HYPO|nr:hypothetical protein NW762_012006 [Fusarium torreyae]
MGTFDNCTEVTPACPVEATTYGYTPALGPNAALLAIFAICAIVQIAVGIWKRVYSYSIAIAVGSAIEAVGYGGRLAMHNNPWSSSGFTIQITCLIIGPSFVAAGIYLTLKHFIRNNNPEFSLLKPRLYTWVFIGCDAGSIVLQAAGGGIAGSAGRDKVDLLDIGNNVMIAGIAFQVITMALCGVLASAYAVRRRRHRNDPTVAVIPAKTKIFACVVAFAYLTILVRCIYRLPEMAGGWGNELMQNEKEFLILDGFSCRLPPTGDENRLCKAKARTA